MANELIKEDFAKEPKFLVGPFSYNYVAGKNNLAPSVRLEELTNTAVTFLGELKKAGKQAPLTPKKRPQGAPQTPAISNWLPMTAQIEQKIGISGAMYMLRSYGHLYQYHKKTNPRARY